MDGPNTNLKFLEELKKTRATAELNDIVNFSICNLHAVHHGAFETGVLSSGFGIKKLLEGAHHIIHNTPARKEDYFNITRFNKIPSLYQLDRWKIRLWQKTHRVVA